LAAADEAVDDSHVKAAAQQEVDHVAADEARPSRDDGHRRDAHQPARFAFSTRTLTYRSSVRLSGNRPSLNARHRSRTASSMPRRGRKPSRAAILSELMW